jgi:hypothetical protein
MCIKIGKCEKLEDDRREVMAKTLLTCSFNQVSLQWNTETQTRTYRTTKKSCESSTWYLVEHNLTIQYIRIISSAFQGNARFLPSLRVCHPLTFHMYQFYYKIKSLPFPLNRYMILKFKLQNF